jgi:DNA-binding GntR family transcriptional regulator
MKQHRYEQIAKDLEESITSGKVPVGDALPTEAELCKKYSVSRYTAREALRQLRDAGLITRRPRAGTTVASAQARSAFSQQISSAADLFRYATDTRFIIEHRERIKASGEDLSVLECRRGQEWIKLAGIRTRPGIATPVCLICVYLNIALAGLEKRIPRSAGVIYSQVEKALGVRIAWIGQRIEAVALDAEQARRLGSKAGACGLRVRRYYYDGTDRLLEVSDSLHAGDRFAYEMRLRRD